MADIEETKRAGKRGPKPKGERKQFTVSFPVDDLALYKALADEQGLATGDYIAAVVARAHGREEPKWVKRGWPYTDEPDNQPQLLSA